MTQSPGNNFFSATDIERYHSGQMSAEERHALEKAALDDPFLADALEGYTHTTTATDDLLKLKARLQEKTASRKVVPLFRRTWMRAAAVILVVAGGVWLLLRTQDSSTDTIAFDTKSTEKVKQHDAVAKETTGTDSVAVGQSVSTESSADQKSDDRNVKLNNATIPDKSFNSSFQKHESESFSNFIQTDTASKEVASGYYNFKTDEIAEKREEKAKNNNSNQVYGNYAPGLANNTNRNAPAGNVTVQERLANNQKNSNRINSWSDSTRALSEDVAQYKDADKTLRRDSVTQLNVVLTPQQTPPLDEVVVSRSVAKKEKSAEGRMAGVVIDTLEPAEGWTNFDDYIAGNLKVPDELKLKPISGGEVELSFDVNEKGEPINIKVVKSLCTKCDEEAKRLLKEGPKWKKKKNKKGRVTIKF